MTKITLVVNLLRVLPEVGAMGRPLGRRGPVKRRKSNCEKGARDPLRRLGQREWRKPITTVKWITSCPARPDLFLKTVG